MVYLWDLLVLAVGATVGSFLYVVALRYGTEKSLLAGRSLCPACHRKLSVIDLVPVFSFIFLRGKCRTCRAKISWQYLLVEILTAVIFFLALLWGPLFAAPFFLFWYFSGGKWMGLGDAKLGLGLGWLLGASSVDAFLLTFWIGAVVSLLIVGWQSWRKNQGRITMKSEVPFAPFLFAATFLVYFFNISMFGLINKFF